MISIIIPIYNAESYIKQTLDCVLAQTYQDYECILIDDGSTDASYDICKEYENCDSRFFCFVQDNGGTSYARNRGLELAKGDFITFLNADDSIPENYLAELYATCKNADIAVCDTVIHKNGKEVFRFTHESSNFAGNEAIHYFLSGQYINPGLCSKLFRKEILKDLQFLPMKTYDDILFVLDAFSSAKKIAVTDKTACHCIQNVNGAMSTMPEELTDDIIVASDRVLQLIDENNVMQPECYCLIVSQLFRSISALIATNSEISADLVKKTRKLLNKYMRMIFSCRLIPLNEKVAYWFFAKGITGKKHVEKKKVY